MRRLGTWRRPSPARELAGLPPRRPKSTNPFTRAQEEDWRRRNKTVLTYVAAAAVGMLGASYAAVPLYRLYCQVGAAAAPGRAVLGGSEVQDRPVSTVSCWSDGSVIGQRGNRPKTTCQGHQRN